MKTLIILLSLWLGGLRSFCFADPAMSYLALCSKNWTCKESFQAFRNESVMNFGLVSGPTFGDSCPCAEKLLRDPRPKKVRYHIINGPCIRNRRCGKYEIVFGETVQSAEKKILAGDSNIWARYNASLIKTRDLIGKGINASCHLSPCLECDFSKQARLKLLQRAKEVIPSCQLVDNPLTDSCLPGYVCEKHGDKPKVGTPCMVDLDGTDFQKVDMLEYMRRYKRCDLTHIWGIKFNCNDNHDPTFIDPRARKCTANQIYFDSAARYLKDNTLPPLDNYDPRDLNGCKMFYDPKDGAGGFTWKQSDTHPGVALLLPRPHRWAVMEAWKHGKAIDRLPYSADFLGDGRPIYRGTKPQASYPTAVVLKESHGAICYRLDYPMYRID